MANRLQVWAMAAAVMFLQAACVTAPRPPVKSIQEVLAAHQAELMAIPGVVGVFIGLAEDEKTECIRVMLKEPGAKQNIPRQIEGYQVITEVTGEIRPFQR
jgi:hypothetical protein